VGLGNVTPSLKVPPNKRKDFESEYNHGGVTVQFARQITVLSLPALRRLRFPVANASGEEQVSAHIEARTTLAALGLAAVARQWSAGFSLRSRCDLIPRDGLVLNLLTAGHSDPFTLSVEEASILVYDASEAARRCGLSWPTGADEPPWENGCLNLTPTHELAEAVAKSRKLAAEAR
jgi:CRISPR-associated protein Csb1